MGLPNGVPHADIAVVSEVMVRFAAYDLPRTIDPRDQQLPRDPRRLSANTIPLESHHHR